MRLLHSFLSWRYGGKQETIFSSASVGKYGFGHYDLNLPQSQLFAGRYGIVVILVAHTIRFESGNEIIRIISARKADRKERNRYEHG